MPAKQLHLQWDLQQAWEQGLLSFQEAWALQDQFLLDPSPVVHLPAQLLPQVEKMHFFHQPPNNLLPL